MNIFNDYTNVLRNVMQEGSKNGKREITHSGDIPGIGDIIKRDSFPPSKEGEKESIFLPSLQEFANAFGTSFDFSQGLGQHPDFAYLKDSGNIELHYIVSMFIDIKGSTNLFKKYRPDIVYLITKIIQDTAIHISLIFGGYVHRLQGDGLFVYFGGKGIEKKLAIERALQNASVFSYYVKNDLKDLFLEQEIEPIYTRIGIDFGDDDDVLWYRAGVGEICEVTTCSLHTSLANKMQGYAENNGVVVGDNIKKFSDPKFFKPVSARDRKAPHFIFEIPDISFKYVQHDFDWFQYLKVQPFIVTDQFGNVKIKSKAAIRQSQNIRPIACQNTPYLGKR